MNSSFVQKNRGFAIFLVLAAIVTVITATIHVSVQQVYRMSANDPQIEAAQAISDLLAKGAPPEAIVGQNSLDVATSLSLFVVILDKDGKVVAGSGKLNNLVPVPPSGVITSLAKSKNMDSRFSWQPQKNVRLAAVMRRQDGDKGYVIVARNLREIEIREQDSLKICFVAWVALLLLSALFASVLSKIGNNLTLVEETNVMEVKMDE